MDDHIIERIKIYFSMLSDNGRELAINKLEEEYCLHCGIKQDEYRCQCWNNK